MKKLSRILIIMAVALLCIFPSKIVNAKTNPLPKKMTLRLISKKIGVYPELEYSFNYSKKITSVKSSNKKIATIGKVGSKEVEVIGYKPGTCTLTVYCGKTKYTCKVKVVAYTNPFKKLNICGTDLKNVFKNGNTEDEYATVTRVKNKKGKISIQLNKPYRLKSIKINGKTVKNNSTITWKNTEWGESELEVKVWDTWTGEYSYFETTIK